MVSLETLSDMIDITAVAADTRLADVDRICDIAKAYHCASTITLPCYLARTMKNTIGYELLDVYKRQLPFFRVAYIFITVVRIPLRETIVNIIFDAKHLSLIHI